MFKSTLNQFIKFILLFSGIILMSNSAGATAKVSCTATTSFNNSGHVTVLPIQVNKVELQDDQEFDLVVPIASTLFTYRVFIGFTEDPAYDEMSDEGTPGFVPKRTIHALILADENGLGTDTYNNRFEVQRTINLSTNFRTEKGTSQMSIFCYLKL